MLPFRMNQPCDIIGITPKIAQYYAKWVEKGKTFQLNQINILNQRFTLLSVSLQGKLSGILKAIEFDETTSNKHIIMAIKHFRQTSSITTTAPKDFLSDEEKKAVYESGKFRVSLYKALLLFHVSDAIKNGTLNLKYSLKYRNFEDYIIDNDKWKNNKDILPLPKISKISKGINENQLDTVKLWYFSEENTNEANYS